MVETKQNILESTHKLFMQYGIKSVTMSDIARHLGISKKTLYAYYDKKEDLIEEGINLHIAEEKEKISEIAANAGNAIEEMMLIYSSIYQQFTELNPSLIYDLKKYYGKIWNKFEEYKVGFIYNFILKNLKRGIAEKIYRENFNPLIVAQLYIAKMEAMVEHNNFSNQQIPITDVYREFAMYHLNAVLNDAGRKYLKEQFNK